MKTKLTPKTLFFLSIFLLAFLTSCKENNTNAVENTEDTESTGIVNFEADDEVMNNAIAQAKATFNVFEDHYNTHKDNQRYFYSIKQEYATPNDGAEHIWIDILSKEENDYVGIVANEPYEISDIAYGDTVVINKDKISDWMIVDSQNNTAKGAYTIKVMRDQMSPEEQKAFDLDYGLTLE